MANRLLYTLGLFMLSAGPAAAEWVCVAQDRNFSYEGRSSVRELARDNAMASCKFNNTDENVCYLRRCEELSAER